MVAHQILLFEPVKFSPILTSCSQFKLIFRLINGCEKIEFESLRKTLPFRTDFGEDAKNVTRKLGSKFLVWAQSDDTNQPFPEKALCRDLLLMLGCRLDIAVLPNAFVPVPGSIALARDVQIHSTCLWLIPYDRDGSPLCTGRLGDRVQLNDRRG